MEDSTIRIKCQNCGAHTIISITPGTSRSVDCSACGTRLVEFESLRGFIYVLSHPQMPNLVKIGFTTRQVEDRVAELNAATAVPGPFVIEGVFPSGEPEQHEFAAHKTFAEARVESKEFFKIDLVEAIRTVSTICGPASYLRTQDLLNQTQSSTALPNGVEPRTYGGSDLSPGDLAKRLDAWHERMQKNKK